MRAFEREQDAHGAVQQANGIQQADDTGANTVAAQAAVSGQKKHLTYTDFAHNMGRDTRYYA